MGFVNINYIVTGYVQSKNILTSFPVLCLCVSLVGPTLCPLIPTQWTVAHQAPLPLGFSRQEHCSGLPCPPSGNHLDPGIEPTFLMSPEDSWLLAPPGISSIDLQVLSDPPSHLFFPYHNCSGDLFSLLCKNLGA